MKMRKYQEGNLIGIGIALGLPIGIAFSVAIGNFAFIGVSLAIGVAIGVALEENAKRNGNLIELTKKERAQRQKLFWITFLAGIILLAFLILRMLIN